MKLGDRYFTLCHKHASSRASLLELNTFVAQYTMYNNCCYFYVFLLKFKPLHEKWTTVHKAKIQDAFSLYIHKLAAVKAVMSP